MKKVLGSILFVIYAIIAITVTVLLLSYNDYNNSQLGGYTVYLVKDDSLEPKYKQGSILFIKSTSDKNVQVGDEMLLYKVINSQEYSVVVESLQEKTQQGSHIVYNVGKEQNYAYDYFIGKTSDTIVVEGWGYILGLLESKWGYLFCVVVVSLLLFLQEVFELVMEIKYGDGKKKKEAVEVEHEEIEEDDDEVEEAEVKPRKTTQIKSTTSKPKTTTAKKTTATRTTTAKTTSTKTTTKKTAPKTATAKKATAPKTATAKKATAPKSTAKKTSTTTTRKRSTTKSAKEEE